MARTFLGGLFAVLLLAAGVFWWQAKTTPLPAPAAEPPPKGEVEAQDVIPPSEPGDLRGPAPPEATELTREQRRFYRYDRNRDQVITRTELMSSRSEAFRKLDADGNNLLTFEEWAVATSDRFKGADADGDGELTPAEFATTAPKRRSTAKCKC